MGKRALVVLTIMVVVVLRGAPGQGRRVVAIPFMAKVQGPLLPETASLIPL
jgi:hypothetical protein